jgi:hypothetical protein
MTDRGVIVLWMLNFILWAIAVAAVASMLLRP